MKKRNAQEWYSSIFVKTAGIVLLTSGIGKVWSGIGKATVLGAADPIFGLEFRKLMLLVGVVEIIIAFLCFYPRVHTTLKLGLLAWIATSFLVYRIGLWSVGWEHPCPCMGSLAGAIHLSDQSADKIMRGVLSFLLVGSYLLLVARSRTGFTTPDTSMMANAPLRDR